MLLLIFADLSNKKTPAYLYFGVTDDIHILLRKASYMSNYSVELFPVPHGTNYTAVGETRVSTEELRAFIDTHSVQLNDDLINNEELIYDENGNVINNLSFDENGNLIGA